MSRRPSDGSGGEGRAGWVGVGLVVAGVSGLLVGIGLIGYATAAYFGWLPEPGPDPEPPPAAWELTPDAMRLPAELPGLGLISPFRHLTLTLVVEGLEAPTAAVAEPGTDRFYVLEKEGRVRRVVGGVLQPEPVLDLTGGLVTDGERGLVGIALHPGFGHNGRVILSYTDRTTDLVIAEYRAVEGGSAFRPEPVTEILRVEQPGLYHHGGRLVFGEDGYLWVGLGDGGGAGGQDPRGHGQDPHTLQATLVRIDVDVTEVLDDGTVLPYGVPADNPFVGTGDGAPEVWAYGLRNPWGFTFDGDVLYIADVGHVTHEEINILPLADSAGANFGWSVFEGPECMREPSCDPAGAVEPIVALGRLGFCAVIGGPVYRGDAISELAGRYFYGDYCTGLIRSLRYVDGVVVEHFDWSDQIGGNRQLTGIFVDGLGEMHILLTGGQIYRIDAVR